MGDICIGDNMDNTMIVAVINGNGKIIHSQPLEMFLRGNRSIPIINYYTGQYGAKIV